MLPDLPGSVETSDATHPVIILNASPTGVCIAGEAIEEGTVVRLTIEDTSGSGSISLYCKAAWSSARKRREKRTGLALLNTNKVLFSKDLAAFTKLLEKAACEKMS